MRRTHDSCTIDGCDAAHKAKGLCNTHYQRTKTGTPLDQPIKHKAPGTWSEWAVDKYGYVRRQRTTPEGVHEAQIQHREVMKKKLGRDLISGENVHHINGVRHDNRPENLELWSTFQPPGQRVDEKIEWAKEFLALYGYEVRYVGA